MTDDEFKEALEICAKEGGKDLKIKYVKVELLPVTESMVQEKIDKAKEEIMQQMLEIFQRFYARD
jgi:hypothetical protein